MSLEEQLIYKEETYKITGKCMGVQTHEKELNEIIYKDAMEYEFKKTKIPFFREQKYKIDYKDIVFETLL